MTHDGMAWPRMTRTWHTGTWCKGRATATLDTEPEASGEEVVMAAPWSSTETLPEPSFPVRRMDFAFDPAEVPRDWYRNDVFLTAIWDSLSLLFPRGRALLRRLGQALRQADRRPRAPRRRPGLHRPGGDAREGAPGLQRDPRGPGSGDRPPAGGRGPRAAPRGPPGPPPAGPARGDVRARALHGDPRRAAPGDRRAQRRHRPLGPGALDVARPRGERAQVGGLRRVPGDRGPLRAPRRRDGRDLGDLHRRSRACSTRACSPPRASC